MSGTPIKQAKSRLPLPLLMQQLGLNEHSKKSARCPFHEDKHNSFSVWQTDGSWSWKCHAGCGKGDEITFLEKHNGISTGEAIKVLLEMAGCASLGRPRIGQRENPEIANNNSFDWKACVDAVTDKHLAELGEWRGYSREFCSSLQKNKLVGLCEGCLGFPVHDRSGRVVGMHCRPKDGKAWFYSPKGIKVAPLVIGELSAGDSIHVFESPWDALRFHGRLKRTQRHYHHARREQWPSRC